MGEDAIVACEDAAALRDPQFWARASSVARPCLLLAGHLSDRVVRKAVDRCRHAGMLVFVELYFIAESGLFTKKRMTHETLLEGEGTFVLAHGSPPYPTVRRTATADRLLGRSVVEDADGVGLVAVRRLWTVDVQGTFRHREG